MPNVADAGRLWSSGRIPRCHRGDPGSIPGRRTLAAHANVRLTTLKRQVFRMPGVCGLVVEYLLAIEVTRVGLHAL